MSDFYTDNPPENLDPKLIEAAITIGAAGWQAHVNSMFGQRTPAQENYYKRASNPMPGDLVLERSSFGLRVKRDRNPEICLGTLYEIKHEWVPYEFEDESEKEGLTLEELGYRDKAVYIQLWVDPQPARLYRWTNCDFISIPRNLTEAFSWEKNT